MDARELDVRYLDNLVLPYDRVTKELSDASPRIVDGSNTYITLGGKISIAPGLDDTGLTSYTIPFRVDRLVIYETVENPPKVYLVASIYNPGPGLWGVDYIRLDAASPAWAGIPTLRGVNSSTAPHEIVCARGLCFIKSFPAAGTDKYGCVIFDGSGSGSPVTRPWGILGPQTPAIDTGSVGYSASTNPVSVYFGWRYCYCYKSISGQYSNRSYPYYLTGSLVTSDDTGQFTNKKPKFTFASDSFADATNYPFLEVFRTTDGGGTFMWLWEVANTGPSTVYTFEDNKRFSTTTTDPKQDIQLDSGNLAPDTVSNSMPPPVDQYHVAGTDAVMQCSPLGYYARRIYYAIGNRLYFSGQEEIPNGVPEESFPNPNGIVGNYYVVQGQVRTVKNTLSSLFVGCSDQVMAVTGQDLTNLQINTVVTDIGSASSQPRAVSSYRDTVYFLSQDLQIYSLTPGQGLTMISFPLKDEFRNAINGNTDVAFETFSRDGNVWLLCAVIDRTSPAATKVWVYDISRDIWFTPWTKEISAMAFGRLRETDQNKHLVVMSWDGTNSHLCVLNLTTQTNLGTAYAPTLTTNLFTVPGGYGFKVPSGSLPVYNPMLSYLLTERTKFTSDTEPTVQFRLDEFSGTMTTGTAVDPPYNTQRTSHRDKWYPVQQTCRRVQMTISKAALNEQMEIQNIGFAFQSEAGA